MPGEAVEMKPQAPVAASATARVAALAEKHKHLIKYVFIGGAASALDVVLFMALYNLAGASALVSHSVSVPSAVLFSFAINARHNFRTTDHVALRLLSFAVVAAIGYASGFAVIEFCRSLGIGANLGKIASLPVVFVIQYALNSQITFRKSRLK